MKDARFGPLPIPPASLEKLSMTRFLLSLALVGCFAFTQVPTSTANAEDAATCNKGLCEGDAVGAFYVTKVGGAADDGVEAGQALCYRCKYGQRPMVMVFTRSTDGAVGELVQKLDASVAKHGDSQLKGLVTLIGGDESELTSKAEAMASAVNSKHIPIVVAKDSKSGPKNYKLADGTAVTVVIVNESQVVARHDFSADKIDVAAVVGKVNEMLN